MGLQPHAGVVDGQAIDPGAAFVATNPVPRAVHVLAADDLLDGHRRQLLGPLLWIALGRRNRLLHGAGIFRDSVVYIPKPRGHLSPLVGSSLDHRVSGAVRHMMFGPSSGCAPNYYGLG